MSKENPKKIGQILIELTFITPLQLEKAVKIQQEIDKHKPLGEILIDLDYLSAAELATAITVQKKQAKSMQTKVSN